MKWITIAFFLLLSGCGTEPQKYSNTLGNQNYSNEPVGIYIVPVWGADQEIIRYLENTLSKQHKVRVVVTTDMGLDEKHFDRERQQFVGEELHLSATEIAKSLRSRPDTPPIIVVIPGDLNSKDFRFRFVFSQHFFTNKISIISLARVNPESYGQNKDVSLTAGRALKLANKALGYHLYGYKPSSDLNNVMYGPIMGPADLDKVNSWYW